MRKSGLHLVPHPYIESSEAGYTGLAGLSTFGTATETAIEMA